jgi:threonine 3-dehydrogenase
MDFRQVETPHEFVLGDVRNPDEVRRAVAGVEVIVHAAALHGIHLLIADIVPYRLELARRLGGAPIDLREQTIDQGVRRYGLARVDLAIDSSGKGAARRAALDTLGQRALMVCVGHGEGLDLSVSPDLIAPEHALMGSQYFCFGDLPENLARLRAHRSYLSQIITHRYPVRDIQPAFEQFFAGQTGKVVIEQ